MSFEFCPGKTLQTSRQNRPHHPRCLSWWLTSSCWFPPSLWLRERKEKKSSKEKKNVRHAWTSDHTVPPKLLSLSRKLSGVGLQRTGHPCLCLYLHFRLQGPQYIVKWSDWTDTYVPWFFISNQAHLGLIQAFRRALARSELATSLFMLSILPTEQLVMMYRLRSFLTFLLYFRKFWRRCSVVLKHI